MSRPASQSANTDDSGNYSFPSLPSGAYTLRAEAQGFKPIEQSGVILDAATRRAGRFHLALGSVTEVVSVAAAAQTCADQFRRCLQTNLRGQLTQIALNGRNYVQMLQLVPASSPPAPILQLGLNATAQRVNGIRTNSLYSWSTGRTTWITAPIATPLSIPTSTHRGDKILTSSYSAEFGGAPAPS
jgi:hypothetical protein